MKHLPQVREAHFIERLRASLGKFAFVHQDFEYILQCDSHARIIIDPDDASRAIIVGFHKTDYVDPFDRRCDCSFAKDVVMMYTSRVEGKWELDVEEYSRTCEECSREMRCFEEIADEVDENTFHTTRGFWYELPLRAHIE